MNAISNLLASRVTGNYTQQRAGNYANKTNQNQTFADIIAAIKQPQTSTQSQTATTATRTNPIEEQQRIIQALLDSPVSFTTDAKGNYPTEEQLDMLREKYKDADFSAYHIYDNVLRHDGGGLTWTTSTGFSEAHDSLLKDLREMGILSEQDMNLLDIEMLHKNINDLGSMRDIHNKLPASEKIRNDLNVPEDVILSGRGNPIDIIEYYRGRAMMGRRSTEYSANAGESTYRSGSASMNSDLYSLASEARERIANILDAIINGAELPT